MSSHCPAPLILASTSRYRRELLSRLGVPFTAVAPAIDEEVLKDAARSPGDLAVYLAEAKARSLASLYPDAVILGSDQTCACEGRQLHKPGSLEAARKQLAQLAGKTHELHTAICIVTPGGQQATTHLDTTRLTMRPLTADEIERYLVADEPWDCVGSYKLECRGIALFDAIESQDHTAITGLPLLAVARILRTYGYIIP
jgi:septum formation protein